MHSANVIATIVFWALMVFVAGFIFQKVCDMCGADYPSFRRGILITIAAAAVAFFTFDGMGYGLVLATRDVANVNLPPGYNYGNWLREPLYLKWQVMGLVPLIRYLIVALAVYLAVVLYVIILKEPYRNCVVILFIQWTLNVGAMALLSFALSNILRFASPTSEPSSEPSAARAPGFSAVPPEMRAATRPTPRGKAAQKKTDAESEAAPAAADLKSVLAAHQDADGSSLSQAREYLHALDERLGPYLEPLKTASRPYTKYLPAVVQEFLDDGGWWLVVAALIVVVFFWLRALARRLKRALFPKTRHRGKRRSDKQSPLAIDLDLVADAFTDPGTHQVTVRGQAGRLRLVILAPSSGYAGDLLPEMAENLLDWLQPGLGEILEADSPRVLVWPRHPSVGRFTEMFHKLVQAPEAKGRRSPWVLLSGAARLGRQTIFLGLAVYLDKTTYTRAIQVEKDKWSEVLGLVEVHEEV
jgi:hypothetical protein